MDRITPQIRIQLLGGFSIACDGQELLSGRGNTRLALLLAFLLLNRNRRASREQVAYLFWKDSTDKQARSNLRGLLTALRRQAPVLAACLIDEETHLGWRSDPAQTIDVDAFEAALTSAAMNDQTEGAEATIDALKRAISLYTGDLLPAFYDDWVLAERLRLQTAHLDALFWLIDLLEKANRAPEAIRFAEQLWQADPLRETSILLLMRLCAAAGDRARALAMYANCARLLVEELGVEPGPAIQELHRKLLQEPAQVARTAAGDVSGDAPADVRIGRAAQWQQLVDSWNAASAGVAHVALLAGEAGIGKSHLARTLGDWCNAQGAVVLSSTCPQARAPVPYVALAPLLASPQLAQRLDRMDDADLACLQMLSPALRRRYADHHFDLQSPQWQQLRLQQALTTLLCDPVEPTLLILDDAQWCDEQSFEWLHYLFAMEPMARLLVLMVVGEGDFDDLPFQRASAALLARGHIRRIELQRLSFEESACLAQRVAAHPLDERTIARLYDASAGNPFFVIELVRMLDSAQGAAQERPPDNALPASVSALVMHRLASLSHPARQLLDIAAVVGERFTIALLRQVDRLPEATRVQAIDELWRCALIVEVGADAYAFHHELVREVIYRQLSDVRRRHLHQRIAEAMVELAASDPHDHFTEEGDRIVHHLELAGHAEEAAHFHAAFVQSRPGVATFLQH